MQKTKVYFVVVNVGDLPWTSWKQVVQNLAERTAEKLYVT